MTQPNFLIIMCDQLAGPALPIYGHPVVKTPNLTQLAAEGAVFHNAYCNSPVCGPSRSSMAAGQLCSRIGTYDNAAEFPSSVPTFAHYLREMGYQTCVSGKMHFVGADQLHGFEERLTTDYYPGGFEWTPDWQRPLTERLSWYHQPDSIRMAGPAKVTMQIDFDNEVCFQAVRKIYDYPRSADKRPFFLMTSFTQPHDPFNAEQKYWDLYDHNEIDMPTIGRIPNEELDPHSYRLRQMIGVLEDDVLSDEMIRNARHAYYGMISYIDAKVGELVQALKDTEQYDNTIIIFTSDHGDMMGERGLWYKYSFYEWSAKVPLIFAGPKIQQKQIQANVSLVDILPTMVDFASGESPVPEYAAPIDGESLKRPLTTTDTNQMSNTVFAEFLGEGVIAPELMIRQGPYKLIFGQDDPPLLYNIDEDPNELRNLAELAEYDAIKNKLLDLLSKKWDVPKLKTEIVADQKKRHLIASAVSKGTRNDKWDFVPAPGTGKSYINMDSDLYNIELPQMWPQPKTKRIT
ncbi:MAG: choline-sulfatase [Chloroflexota bacterium]